MWREFCVNVKESYSCTDSVSTGLPDYGLSKVKAARSSLHASYTARVP